MPKISLLQVKQALLDERFRKKLPEELKGDVEKFLSNPGCACNHPLLRRIIRTVDPSLLKEYFPGHEVPSADEEIRNLTRNDFSVISCHINELRDRLRALPYGQKQIAIARWEDQVTVVVNDLGI